MLKKLIKKIIAWRFTCTHNDYTIIYECFQDRYLECKCSNCGEIFYKELE